MSKAAMSLSSLHDVASFCNQVALCQLLCAAVSMSKAMQYPLYRLSVRAGVRMHVYPIVSTCLGPCVGVYAQSLVCVHT